MSNEITTTDLSKFGWRERKMAAELLTASCEQGLPADFEDDGITIMMNTRSGNVFLTNSDYQVAMMNGDKLESFYSCPECGHEGFKEDMQHDGNAECQRYLRDIGAVELITWTCPGCGATNAETAPYPDTFECEECHTKFERDDVDGE